MPLNLRQNVLQLKPYSPGKPTEEVKRELGLERVVKLASNENPLGPSPSAVAAIQRAAEQVHLYPDASGYELKQVLADFVGVQPNQIVLGNGSDELIHILGCVMLSGASEAIMVGQPSFVRYDAAALLAGSQLIKVPVTEDWRLDLPAMAERLTPQVRIVFLANPNNPTGTYVTHREVENLLDRLPDGALLVLDEAYFEFAVGQSDFVRSIDLLRSGAPVMIMRTLSKAYGLAGMRLGYAVAPPELADAMERAREPFNVNSLAQAAAIAALSDQAHVHRTVEENARGMSRIAAAAQGLGFSVLPAFANFVCIDLQEPARPWFEALLHEGVIVRSGDVLGMPHHLRVSIGTAEEIDFFIEAFRRVAGQLQSAGVH